MTSRIDRGQEAHEFVNLMERPRVVDEIVHQVSRVIARELDLMELDSDAVVKLDIHHLPNGARITINFLRIGGSPRPDQADEFSNSGA